MINRSITFDKLATDIQLHPETKHKNKRRKIQQQETKIHTNHLCVATQEHVRRFETLLESMISDSSSCQTARSSFSIQSNV